MNFWIQRTLTAKQIFQMYRVPTRDQFQSSINYKQFINGKHKSKNGERNKLQQYNKTIRNKSEVTIIKKKTRLKENKKIIIAKLKLLETILSLWHHRALTRIHSEKSVLI